MALKKVNGITDFPEISLFKFAYDQPFHFAIDSKRIPIDLNFGEEIKVDIPKNDNNMIYNIDLVIRLPYISFQRTPPVPPVPVPVPPYQNSPPYHPDLSLYSLGNLRVVIDYIKINTEAYRIVIANSTSVLGVIQGLVFAYYAGLDLVNEVPIRTAFSVLEPTEYTVVDFANIVVTWVGTVADLIIYMNVILDKTNVILKRYEEGYITTKTAYDDFYGTELKFAWNKKIGHVIVDRVDINIRGNTIDSHDTDLLEILYQLDRDRNTEYLYDKLIGNINKLITYDRIPKEEYEITIPLKFWFCRKPESALSLISSLGNKLVLGIKLKNLNECCYVESSPNNLTLNDLVHHKHIKLEASLNVEYIILNQEEMHHLNDEIPNAFKSNFVQPDPEYLIEQSQKNEFNISGHIFSTFLNFICPCKSLIWIAYKKNLRENINDATEIDWFDYSFTPIVTPLNPDYIIYPENPIDKIKFNFNGVDITKEYDSMLYNNALPLTHYKTIPEIGINVLPFSLVPRIKQPTGSCNLSTLKNIKVNANFKKEFDVSASDPVVFKVFCINYNILSNTNGIITPLFS